MTSQYLVSRAALALCAAVLASAAPASADQVRIDPRVIPVGKWAEGLAFDGSTLWIAESGQRSIVQINPAQGGVMRRIQVGRLPVGMVFANGAIHALVQTDKLIWQQFPGNPQGRQIAGLDGCPNGLAAGRQHLWVLTEPNCSDDFDRVIRLDPNTNERRAVDLPFDKAQAIAAGNGRVFVARFRGQSLSIIDEQSMAVSNVDLRGAALSAVTANGPQVYVGGRTAFGNAQGLVAAVDPGAMRETRRHALDQPIAAITDDGRNVVAVGEQGRIYVFAAGSLDLLRTIDMPSIGFNNLGNGGGPKGALLQGDTLYVTSGQHFGENGAVLVLDGWRPAAMPATNQPTPSSQPAPQPAPQPTAGATDCPYQVTVPTDSTGIWMYQDPDVGAPRVVAIPADARGLVADRCLTTWCHVTFRNQSGWVQRNHIKPVCN